MKTPLITLALIASINLGGLMAADPPSTSVAQGGPYFENFRGNRMGSYPRCTPPIQWDGNTGYNLVWKTVLPNWCEGLPIIVEDRIYVMSEPGWKSDFPELVCLDAHTGTILWQRAIDHVPLAEPDAERRKVVYQAWASFWERFRIAFLLAWASEVADKANDAAALAAVEKEVRSYGWAMNDGTGLGAGKKGLFGRGSASSYGVLRGWGNGGDNPGVDPAIPMTSYTLKSRYGLRTETFWGFGAAREGMVFATPVTDGTTIYVVTELGVFAAFDLDGRQRWLTWVQPRFNPGGHDDSICHTPVLIDGVLISTQHTAGDAGKGADPVLALDARTGQVLWKASKPPPGNGSVNSSFPLWLNGVGYMISTGGVLYRAKDGKTSVLSLPDAAKGGVIHGIDDERDLAFMTGAGRKTLVIHLVAQPDGAVQGQVIRSIDPGLVYEYEYVAHQGILYSDKNGSRVDVMTGTRLPDWPTVRERRWFNATDGRFLYYHGGSTGVRSMRTGRQVATNDSGDKAIVQSSKELQTRLAATFGHAFAHGSFSDCYIMAKNRFLVRTNTHLYCFGDPTQPYPIATHRPQADRELEKDIDSLSSAKDLLPYLNQKEARARYLGLRRLNALPATGRSAADLVPVLKTLAIGDAYERIRAEAVLALGVSTDGTGTGAEVLEQAIIDPKNNTAARTLDLLGAEAARVLKPLLHPGRPLAERKRILDVCIAMLEPAPEVRALLVTMGSAKDDPPGTALAVHGLTAMYPEDTGADLIALMEHGVGVTAGEKELRQGDGTPRTKAYAWLMANRRLIDNRPMLLSVVQDAKQDWRQRYPAAQALLSLAETWESDAAVVIQAGTAAKDANFCTGLLRAAFESTPASEALAKHLTAGLSDPLRLSAYAYHLVAKKLPGADQALAALAANRGVFDGNWALPMSKAAVDTLDLAVQSQEQAVRTATADLIVSLIRERGHVPDQVKRLLEILGRLPTAEIAPHRAVIDKIAAMETTGPATGAVKAAKDLLEQLAKAAQPAK